jgi:hypothetical protein
VATEWFHRSCRDGAERIDATLTLRPLPQGTLGRLPMIWLTSQHAATRAMLGLSSRTLSCDRMEALYRVVPEDADIVVRWGDLMRTPSFEPFLPGARRLMAVRGTRPGLWGISPSPLRVERIE